MASDKLPWGLKTKGIAPGSIKNITENKLKAFNIGSMNIKKGVTKKELDDIKKKKEQEEAAEVYKEFVESFEESERGLNRAWIKGGVVNPGKGEEDVVAKLYKPTSKLLEKKIAAALPSTSRIKEEEKPERPNKPTPTPQRLWTPTPVEIKKKQTASEKRKTNLELFKEELKVIQTERQERKKARQDLGIVEEPGRKSSRFDSPEEPVATGVSLGIKPAATEDYRMGSYTYETDTQTTNLYLGNLNPKMTEVQLCDIFGKYGPLASVKVMWPRSDEEKARGRNCGFVAYMNRKDGERALNALQGKMIQEFEMKLGWGKAVPIPPHPVYIPPSLSELTLPPPPSGLPFNAQPMKSKSKSVDKAYGSVPPPGVTGDNSDAPSSENDTKDDLEKKLANAVVKVVIPTERPLLNTIHRMIEFVVREGPMFEAMIMNRELHNPLFRFLFENQTPAHIYYRWKLFSILQGDNPYRWKTEEFRMFQNGSVWRPPQMNPYSQGMPDELIEGDDNETPVRGAAPQDLPKKGGLTESQRDRLEDQLRNLTPERVKVGDVMVWCLDHADSAEEIVECIAESLSILQTPVPKKIARLFLISDILHNCSARVPHASFYRKMFEARLPEIFKDIHEAYEQIDARLKAEQFKQKVMSCFRAWEDWAIYASEYLINLQNIFLGLVANKTHSIDSPSNVKEEDIDGTNIDELDGIPLEELDGMPIDGEPMKEEPTDDANGIPVKGIVPYGDDIDGEPIDDKKAVKTKPLLTFAPSKWETVDESELEAQAITLSKWDLLEQKRKEEEAAKKKVEDIDGCPLDDDVDGASQGSRKDSSQDWQMSQDSNTSVDRRADDEQTDRTAEQPQQTLQQRLEMIEAKRAKLREIEVKVMKYQDELEAGKRSRKPGTSIMEQVEYYRKKQLRKEDEKEKEREREQQREEERERVKEWERAREKEKNRGKAVRERSRDADKSISVDDVRDDSSRRSDRSRSDRASRDVEKSSRDSERKGHDRDHRDTGSERSRRDDDKDRSFSSSSYDRIQTSRDESPQSEASSSLVGASPLVNYPSTPPSSYRDSPAESSRHRHSRAASPKKSSRSNSPRKSRRSRSRSTGHHSKHKRSRRS